MSNSIEKFMESLGQLERTSHITQDFYLSEERIGEIWLVRTNKYKRRNSRKPESSISNHLMPLQYQEVKAMEKGAILHKVLLCLCLETGEKITRNPEYCFNNLMYSTPKTTENWYKIA
jgi:hypothetical protein